METILRKRTIRPSSRNEKSISYKIDTKAVTKGDTLVVEIDHESKSFNKTFQFKGSDISDKNSISFRVKDFETSIELSWSGAQPTSITTNDNRTIQKQTKQSDKVPKENIVIKYDSINLKQSFEPISNFETKILILGTLPGDKSLNLNQYYADNRNLFWQIISNITNLELPKTYEEKNELLLKTKIGIWDVAHKAIRKGSTDKEIVNEEPNDIDSFIDKHKNLRIIGFNGKKASAIYDKYFSRKNNLKYILLPSTSSMNQSNYSFETICNLWKQILID